MKQDKLDKWVIAANAMDGELGCNIPHKKWACDKCPKKLNRFHTPVATPESIRQFARDHLTKKGYDWRTGERLAKVEEPLVRHDPIGTEGSVSQTAESETQELTEHHKLEQIKAGSCASWKGCDGCPIREWAKNNSSEPIRNYVCVHGKYRASDLSPEARAEAARMLAEMDAKDAPVETFPRLMAFLDPEVVCRVMSAWVEKTEYIVASDGSTRRTCREPTSEERAKWAAEHPQEYADLVRANQSQAMEPAESGPDDEPCLVWLHRDHPLHDTPQVVSGERAIKSYQDGGYTVRRLTRREALALVPEECSKQGYSLVPAKQEQGNGEWFWVANAPEAKEAGE